MNKLTAPRRGFAFAVSVSLAIHLIGVFLLLGAGKFWLTAPAETKVEWVWTAPAAAPAVAPTAPTVPASLAAAPPATSPATPTAAMPPASPPAAATPSAAAPATPAVTPAAPPSPAAPAAPAAPPAVELPSSSLPSGTGYAIVPPRLRERPPLVLPPQLTQAGVSGEVLLQVEVLEDGRIGRTSVTRSSGVKALDDAARQYVAAWRFDPAWQPQGQKPVRVITALWVRYGK